VGCLVNGAGLAMATMDLVRGAGATPANFLDVGGGADEAKVAKAVNIMLSDPDVKSILVNIFGGILRSDVVARGVVQAYQETGSEIPLTIRLQGVQVEEARAVLEESGLRVSFAETLVDVEARLSEARS
jgi:succinyl-CoA synthetase beta subunit